MAQSEELEHGYLSLRNRDLKKFTKEHLQGTDPKDIWNLDLCNNQLKELPEWFCEFTNLDYLDISKNQISELPDCVSNFPLRTLRINGNRLETLPESIKNLDKLTYLVVSHNPSDLTIFLSQKQLELLSHFQSSN